MFQQGKQFQHNLLQKFKRSVDFEVNLILSWGGERSNNGWEHIIGCLPTWTNCSSLTQETTSAEII